MAGSRQKPPAPPAAERQDEAQAAPFDARIQTAANAAFSVFEYLETFWIFEAGQRQRLRALSGALAPDIGQFVQRLGVRASAEVVATELRSQGRLDSGPVSRPERLLLEVFIAVINGLARFERDEIGEHLAANAAPAPVKKVPRDETTLETVDGLNDTWRGRGRGETPETPDSDDDLPF